MKSVALLALFGLAPAMSAGPPVSLAGLGAPANLRCEYLENPLGIDQVQPRLSWEMVDSRRGAAQTACQILASDDAARLAGDEGNLWDTGKVASSESIQIVYAGRPLRSRMRVYWKVRVWDSDGQPSPWSAPARWSMGLLTPEDWKAKWIGDPATPRPPRPPNNGYHSELTDNADAEKWIDIDLGQSFKLNQVILFPARPYNWTHDEPGFLFPVRFKILTSSNADFSEPTCVVDRTKEDVPNPKTEPQFYQFPPTEARYVRLLVTRLGERNPGEYGLALAEMTVDSGPFGVASGKSVKASDSLERPEWSARFLVDNDTTSHGFEQLESLPPPRLRKEFAIEGDAAIKHAVVYATALGLYDLSINGQRVGDRRLAPEWTDYHKRVQYQTYDVTNLLKAGENAIGVQLADGWYAGRIGLTGVVPGGQPRAIYGRQPRLLLQLEITRADGAVERVVSDESWRLATDGPLRAADLLDGEFYTAQLETPGWDRPGFDESAWRTAGVVDEFTGELVAQTNEPIRVTRETAPISVTEAAPRVYVFDMGQNFAGWCRLKMRGKAGEMATLRHAEVLNPDGTIYTDNLRSAKATDRYTFRGDGVEVYEPRFTYHGFRYVELTGLSEAPTKDALTGCAVHSAAPEIGEFECSSPLLNKLWSNILWTQRSNMHSIPTDCPQRDERLGWTGDILAFSQTACFNMDMAAFLTKWVRDLRDAQTPDGRFPDFAPHPYDPARRFSGVPAWGDAGVFVPWSVYVNYGDTRMLEEHFDAARRWVDWIHAANPDLLWKNERHNDYGDWLNADTLKLAGWPQRGAEMPKETFATAFFARSTEIVAKMARVIGRADDADQYDALAARIRDAFKQAYVDADGRIAGDTQAGYAIALHFGLLPEQQRAAAAKRMVECFERYNGNISTGFHSTICLMNELTRNGYNEEAYRLITNRTMPSWGYAIDHGATTIWERWDGYVDGRGFQDPGMNSFAHYALGSVGEWMVRTIVGINPDPIAPAYKRFVLRPIPGGDLTWARGEYHSIHGRIACAWRIEGARITVDVTVPANTSAVLHVPTSSPVDITENGNPLADSAGVEVLETGSREIVCRLAAGKYRFSASLQR